MGSSLMLGKDDFGERHEVPRGVDDRPDRMSIVWLLDQFAGRNGLAD